MRPSSRSKSARASSIAPDQGQRLGEPEGAGEELALVTGQPVVASSVGRVARDEAVARQLALDRVDRADHALVVRREEADQRDQQHARVELLASRSTA